MKRSSLLLTALFIVFPFLFLSCDEDDIEQENINQIKSIVQSGNWIIGSYLLGTSDETSHFFGYTVTFASNGNLSATDGTITLNGIWSVENQGDGIVFKIHFNAFNKFEDLNESWNFTSYSNTRIELLKISGGGAPAKYLTFQRPIG